MDKDIRISMKDGPCIRGLKAFKKCPGKIWDGKEGCPLWFEDLITIQDGQAKKEVIRSQCVDRWQYDFLWWNNARLAGNQQAVESFRNNMSTKDGPKPDPSMMRLVQIAEENRSIKRITS